MDAGPGSVDAWGIVVFMMCYGWMDADDEGVRNAKRLPYERAGLGKFNYVTDSSSSGRVLCGDVSKAEGAPWSPDPADDEVNGSQERPLVILGDTTRDPRRHPSSDDRSTAQTRTYTQSRETSLIPVFDSVPVSVPVSVIAAGCPCSALPCAVVSRRSRPTNPLALAFAQICHGLAEVSNRQRRKRSGEKHLCRVDVRMCLFQGEEEEETVERTNSFCSFPFFCFIHPSLHPHTRTPHTHFHFKSIIHSLRTIHLHLHTIHSYLHQNKTSASKPTVKNRRTVHVPAMSRLSIRGRCAHSYSRNNTPTPSPLSLTFSSTSFLLFLVFLLSTHIHRADASLFGNDGARLNYDRVSVKSKPTSVHDAEIIAPGKALAAGVIEATGTLPKQGVAVRNPTHIYHRYSNKILSIVDFYLDRCCIIVHSPFNFACVFIIILTRLPLPFFFTLSY